MRIVVVATFDDEIDVVDGAGPAVVLHQTPGFEYERHAPMLAEKPHRCDQIPRV
jgi:hypothetical protein